MYIYFKTKILNTTAIIESIKIEEYNMYHY